MQARKYTYDICVYIYTGKKSSNMFMQPSILAIRENMYISFMTSFACTFCFMPWR